MTVRVSRPEERDKAEDPDVEREAEGVRGEQSLGADLRCSIERRLRREGAVFGRRDERGLTVDGTGRGEHDPADAVLAHRFEHVLRPEEVLLDVLSRM